MPNTTMQSIKTSVCSAHGWSVQKRLNHKSAGLGGGVNLRGPDEPYPTLYGVRSHGKGHFWGYARHPFDNRLIQSLHQMQLLPRSSGVMQQWRSLSHTVTEDTCFRLYFWFYLIISFYYYIYYFIISITKFNYIILHFWLLHEKPNA